MNFNLEMIRQHMEEKKRKDQEQEELRRQDEMKKVENIEQNEKEEEETRSQASSNKSTGALSDIQQKSIELFKEKCKNTLLVDVIDGTSFGLFMIDPKKMEYFISNFRETAGIVSNPFGAYEIKMYRFGAIRHVKNPFVAITSKSKQQYEIVQDYLI